MQYHSLFIGVSSFAITLAATANLISAFISFYLAISITGALMISVVSIQTSVCKDPAFYQSFANEAYSFIEKVAPKENDRIHEEVEEF